MRTKFIKLRTDAKLTQRELAEKLGVTQSLISNLERGVRGVDDYVASIYCEYFKKDLNYFMDQQNPLYISEEDVNRLDDEQLMELLYLVTKRITQKQK